jgi:hypothetical protein
VPQVPLDGIEIAIAHARPEAEVAGDIERFASDVATNRFPDWGVKLEREGERMRLVGRRDGSHFEALVRTEPGRILLTLKGVADIGFLKYTAAGGAEGVRSRVRSTLESALRQQFGGAP